MSSTIDEKTSIPLYAVLATIPFVVAAAMWLASISATASNAEQVNAEQEEMINHNRELLVDIRERLIRIETKLNK